MANSEPRNRGPGPPAQRVQGREPVSFCRAADPICENVELDPALRLTARLTRPQASKTTSKHARFRRAQPDEGARSNNHKLRALAFLRNSTTHQIAGHD